MYMHTHSYIHESFILKSLATCDVYTEINFMETENFIALMYQLCTATVYVAYYKSCMGSGVSCIAIHADKHCMHMSIVTNQ